MIDLFFFVLLSFFVLCNPISFIRVMKYSNTMVYCILEIIIYYSIRYNHTHMQRIFHILFARNVDGN